MLSKNITQIHVPPVEPVIKVKQVIDEKAGKTLIKPDEPKGDADLFDIEEEEVSVPAPDEIVSKSKNEIPVADKLIEKEKVVKGRKPEVKEEILIKEELLTEEIEEKAMTLGESIGDKHQVMNDLLSHDRIDSGFEGIPLKSIREGIGINDRFLYMRELFGNDPDKYEKTIASLDEFAAIEEAVGYLKQNFKWNKSEAGQKFLVLVKRRFTK